MGYRVKKKTKGGDVEKLLKHLKEISEKHIQIGYFQDTGDHPTAEIPFADLMHIHELGLGNYPARSVLGTGLQDIAEQPTEQYLTSFKKLIVDVGKSNTNINNVAEEAKDIVKDVFGDSRLTITSNPTPLVDTGELRDALTYKIE